MSIRSKGFTIIELVVATAVIVLLLAVSLPRYGRITDEQQFRADAQKITACLQDAQRQAAAPKDTPDRSRTAFSVAELAYTDTDDLQCSYVLYAANVVTDEEYPTMLRPKYAKDNNIVSDGYGGTPVVVSGIELCNVTLRGSNADIAANLSTSNPPKTVRLAYGVASGGASTGGYVEGAGSQVSGGVEGEIGLKAVGGDCKTAITTGRLGSPIRLQ